MQTNKVADYIVNSCWCDCWLCLLCN